MPSSRNTSGGKSCGRGWRWPIGAGIGPCPIVGGEGLFICGKGSPCAGAVADMPLQALTRITATAHRVGRATRTVWLRASRI
jgi:hypothetical protein